MEHYFEHLSEEQYFNEWLDNWNRICMTNDPKYPHFIPTTYELHYKEAKEISDYLSDLTSVLKI